MLSLQRLFGTESTFARVQFESQGGLVLEFLRVGLGLTWRVTQRVHVSNDKVLGFWVIVTIIYLLGEYMTIGYLDPYGQGTK